MLRWQSGSSEIQAWMGLKADMWRQTGECTGRETDRQQSTQTGTYPSLLSKGFLGWRAPPHRRSFLQTCSNTTEVPPVNRVWGRWPAGCRSARLTWACTPGESAAGSTSRRLPARPWRWHHGWPLCHLCAKSLWCIWGRSCRCCRPTWLGVHQQGALPSTRWPLVQLQHKKADKTTADSLFLAF